MTLKKSSLLISFGIALVFSLFYLAGFVSESLGFFDTAEERIYDVFLRFRPKRERLDTIVFLDVDDLAVAHVGVFPWPRSVVADGLLRLKEYGVQAAVFDIEYIDKSPSGIDSVYLDRNLPDDFNRSFSDIGANVSGLVSLLRSGGLPASAADEYTGRLLEIIDDTGQELLGKVSNIARDNDEYLAQAAKLLGCAWLTVDLQLEFPLEGEQAERRGRAEERFSYPVEALRGAYPGSYIDVLPPIPSLLEACQGAGFTNVTIDTDGVRRRIYLCREVNGFWYLQLALAPLVKYLGNPRIQYEPGKLTIYKARLPGAGDGEAKVKDIVIPLDSKGAMMLDWPKENYRNSFTHVSFAKFSYLEEYETSLRYCISELLSSSVWDFPDPQARLYQGYNNVVQLLDLFDACENAKRESLAENSDDKFNDYIVQRDKSRSLIQDLIELNLTEYLEDLQDGLVGEYPQQAEGIIAEIEFAKTYFDTLESIYYDTRDIESELKESLAGKICVIGRSDTGTTDIGVNPFWGQYINVGTHAVVLDTILSESFINPLSKIWSVIITLIFVPLLITLTSRFKSGFRTGIGFGGGVLLFLISFGLFYFKGLYLGPLGPVLAMILAVIVRETVAFVGSEQEKQFIRKAFSTYLSGDVVKQILDDPSSLHLGGQEKSITAIFTDIQGFSTISYELTKKHGAQKGAEALVGLLNAYLSPMSNVILSGQGTIDKYEGDAIIAFFGAPLDLRDHAERACKSAISMKKLENELNPAFIEQGLSPSPLLTRIGINTGSMVVGNMGTENKFDYTIIGNEVNLAARLEGVNKQYGTWILASDATVKAAGETILSRYIDKVRVVGIEEPVRLYEIIGFKGDISGEELEQALERLDLFSRAVKIFEDRDWARVHKSDWTGSQTAFMKVLDRFPNDGPSKEYLKFCQQFKDSPPDDRDEEGVRNLDKK
jgi:adenylate cyclase